jgi:hypothetical protein
MALSENIITKLFDTLSKSIDNNKTALDKSVTAQIDSINYLKPKVDKIEDNSNTALDMLTTISGKITTMIVVVLAASAVLGIAYFVARFMMTTPV